MRLPVRISFSIHITNLQGYACTNKLLELFESYQLPAHFFIALGQDTSSSYLPEFWFDRNHKTRMGRQCKDNLLAIQSAGHEIGISSFHPKRWNEKTPFQSSQWIEKQLEKSILSYETIFQKKPLSHSAHQWQTHSNLFDIEQSLGFDFASDVRGKYAFYPETGCMQIPTSLATLQELQQQHISIEKLHEEMFDLSQPILPTGHIFHIDAEYDTQHLFSTIEACLVMWKGAQFEFSSLTDIHKMLQGEDVPKHQIGWSQVEGSNTYYAHQGQMISAA